MQLMANRDVSLSEEQIELYGENGFLIIPDVFAPSVCDDMKAEAEKYASEDYRIYSVSLWTESISGL